MTKKRALGKGLSALLESAETDITSGKTNAASSRVLGSVAMLPVQLIEANPFQPRTAFDEEAMHELVQSIRELGIIQPVTVRKMGYDHFQLISGERRFRAAQVAGLEEIPAYIRIADDQRMLEMALVENIQRKNLDAIEIALSYERLIEECALTQEQLSSRVGKQRSTIANYLRLLKLPPHVQAAIRRGALSMGHARALLALPEQELEKYFEKVISEGWSVRQVEQATRKEATPGKARPKVMPLSFAHQKIKSDLTDFFGTKVDLRRDAKGTGKIEITFASEDELQRILQKLES